MLKFLVEGSRGNKYSITAERKENNLTMICDCAAGEHGMYCKHRFALLDGDVTHLISGNESDVEALRGLYVGTDVELRLTEVRLIDAEAKKIKRRLSAAKKALAKAFRD